MKSLNDLKCLKSPLQIEDIAEQNTIGEKSFVYLYRLDNASCTYCIIFDTKSNFYVFACLCHQLYVSKTAVAGLLVNRELSIIHVSFWISMSVDSLLQTISKPLERFGSKVIHLSL